MKAKTPEQLAKKDSTRDKFTLYLSVKNMNEIKQRAGKAGISSSAIVDEAISAYLYALKDK